MTEPFVQAVTAGAALVGLVVVALAGLWAWHEWLDLQRLHLAGRGDREGLPPATSGARIELADLKERIRKLEAIAAGVDF